MAIKKVHKKNAGWKTGFAEFKQLGTLNWGVDL
jgi:hypothetical protein